MQNRWKRISDNTLSFFRWINEIRLIFKKPAYLSLSFLLVLGGLGMMNPSFWQTIIAYFIDSYQPSTDSNQGLMVFAGFVVVILGVGIFFMGVNKRKRILNEIPRTLEISERIKISFSLPTVSSDLFGREKYLSLIDKAWNDDKIKIFCLVGLGGEGKTSIINKWLDQLRQNNFDGIERVYVYSFYKKQQSGRNELLADHFFEDALLWFDSSSSLQGNPLDKGRRLADCIRNSRTLLILDGLEAIQHPPGARTGKLTDYRMSQLLKNIAIINPGFCIITSRLLIRDLSNFFNSSVENVHLDKLSLDAAVDLLNHLGVKGKKNDLEDAAEEFSRYALAIELLGKFIVQVYNGDIGMRNKIDRCLYDETVEGRHAKWIIDSYQNWLFQTRKGKRLLNILYIAGLVNYPFSENTLLSLSDGPKIPFLTDQLKNVSESQLKADLHELRELGLILGTDKANPKIIDCHPVIREHFRKLLENKESSSFLEGEKRVNEFYLFSYNEKELIDIYKENYSYLKTSFDEMRQLMLLEEANQQLYLHLTHYHEDIIRIGRALKEHGHEVDHIAERFSINLKNGCDFRNELSDWKFKNTSILPHKALDAITVLPAYACFKGFKNWNGFINIHEKDFDQILDVIYVPKEALENPYVWWRIYKSVGRLFINSSDNIVYSDIPEVSDLTKHGKDSAWFDLLIDIASEIIGFELCFFNDYDLFNKNYIKYYLKEENEKIVENYWHHLLRLLVVNVWNEFFSIRSTKRDSQSEKKIEVSCLNRLLVEIINNVEVENINLKDRLSKTDYQGIIECVSVLIKYLIYLEGEFSDLYSSEYNVFPQIDKLQHNDTQTIFSSIDRGDVYGGKIDCPEAIIYHILRSDNETILNSTRSRIIEASILTLYNFSINGI
jgi:hypothetical protein